MHWSTGAVRSLLVAACCLTCGACGGSNKDVSGAYELSFDDGSLHAILYLVRSPDDEYLAVLDGSECTVVRGDDDLTLNACSLDAPGLPNQFESSGPFYMSFKLERDSSGDLATLSAFDYASDKRVAGKLERSRHAPLLRGKRPQSSPESTVRPLLPWDALGLDFGDGVSIDEETLIDTIEVEASSGDDVTARWTYRSIPVPDSARKLTSFASATINWPDLLGQRITFSLAAGTPDSAGRTMSNYMEADFQLPLIAAAARAWELDDERELAGLVKWGTVTSVRETTACPGTCLQMSRYISACAEPGLAGLLDAHEASKLVVRVRAATSKRMGYPLELGIHLGEAGVPNGARSSSRELLLERGEAQDTDFRVIEVPLSAAQRRERLPFELRLIYSCPWTWTTSPTAAPTTDVTVLIDRIAAE